MGPEEFLERFWDATLDGDEVDHEAFLAEGSAELAEAVSTHRLLQRAAQRWRQPTRPRQLGRFEVLSDLGAGGLGRVYLGWDPELRRHVAIKVIARDRWAINEARAIARLEHRSIVKVFEVGPDRLVMELLDGGSLQDKIEAMAAGESTHLDGLRARLHCLVRIAEGLAYCHERGILHRDVKPGNVLFAKDDDHPRLMDFGLAHLDELESLDITQNLVGSPAYLAPEQVESGETGTDSRSDVFSFGVLAYELLTLECPFKRETRTATLAAVVQSRPRAPRALADAIPGPVEHIVQHCLEPDPRERYQSMAEVVSDLQNALADRPISVGGRSLVHRGKLLYQRNRRVTWFASAGVGAALLFAAALWLRSLREERREFLAQMEALEARIATIEGSEDFIITGFSLSEATQRAQLYDGTALGRALFGPTSGRTREVAEAWSRRLGEAISEIESAAEVLYPPDTWKPILRIDELLLPEAEWNLELRNRGRVLVSTELGDRDDLVFLRQAPRGEGFEAGFIDFKETRFEEFPSLGYYRVRVPGVWERDYFVRSTWQPPIRLELTPRRLATDGWLELPDLGVVASPLITNTQYLEFCRRTGREARPRGVADGPEPYSGTWNEMQAFADWAGARLPSGGELATLVTRFGTQEARALTGEFISDVFDATNPSDVAAGRYALILEAPEAPPRSWCTNASRGHPFSVDGEYFGFRVLYTTAAPALDQELQDQ
jgi:hypothetical protein